MGPLFSPPSVASDQPGGAKGQLIMPGGVGLGQLAHRRVRSRDRDLLRRLAHPAGHQSARCKTDDPDATMAYATQARERREGGTAARRYRGRGPDLSIDGLPIFKAAVRPHHRHRHEHAASTCGWPPTATARGTIRW